MHSCGFSLSAWTSRASSTAPLDTWKSSGVHGGCFVYNTYVLQVVLRFVVLLQLRFAGSAASRQAWPRAPVVFLLLVVLLVLVAGALRWCWPFWSHAALLTPVVVDCERADLFSLMMRPCSEGAVMHANVTGLDGHAHARHEMSLSVPMKNNNGGGGGNGGGGDGWW